MRFQCSSSFSLTVSGMAAATAVAILERSATTLPVRGDVTELVSRMM
jgi:hypothetical protein